MHTYGLTTIGNAIVDVIAPTSHEFIESQSAFGMVRHSMNLISAERAEQLYNLLGPATETSGGSAANTLACFTSFGGKGAYIGKVANDQLGKIFTHDMRSIGASFNSSPLVGGKPTAQSMILVTPDAHRTMNTYLGACTQLTEDDIDEAVIGNSLVTYLEGYLFDEPKAKAAFFKAADYVAKYERKLSLTLSDSFCVTRHYSDFHRLVENHVDILFANEAELLEFTQKTNLDQAVKAIRGTCPIIAVTLGDKGSIILDGESTISIAPIHPKELVDTTGAGDAYAGGFLFGLSSGKPLAECGHLGSIAASEVISHIGPRPQIQLKTLMETKS